MKRIELAKHTDCRARTVEDLRAAAGREARSAEGDPTPTAIPDLQFMERVQYK